MTNQETIANLNMIRVAFVEPVTKEQRKLIDDTFDNAIKTLEQKPTKEEQALLQSLRLPPVNPQVSCEDAVSRQAVLETLDDMDNALDEDRTVENYKELLKECYEVLPSVNPQEPNCKDCDYKEWLKDEIEPKIGHWITDAKTYYEELNKRGLGVDEYTPYFTDDIACSECLAKYSMLDNETQFFKHCPNCGAKMQESED